LFDVANLTEGKNIKITISWEIEVIQTNTLYFKNLSVSRRCTVNEFTSQYRQFATFDPSLDFNLLYPISYSIITVLHSLWFAYNGLSVSLIGFG